MRNISVIAFAMMAAGSGSATASTLFYNFSFHNAGVAAADFAYPSGTPTVPGTDLSDILRAAYPSFPPIVFPVTRGLRDAAGAWYFIRAFETTSFTWVALTDTSFPNLPGVYVGLPAQRLTRFGEVTPLSVDISITETPEPGTSSMLLAGLILSLSFVARTWTLNRVRHRPHSR